MKIVIYDFPKKQISVHHHFNLLGGKLNDLKTDAKPSIVERLEILTKIKYVATNAFPDAMWDLMKESIDIKMRNKDPILYLATVTIKLVEAEIYALKIIFKTLKTKVGANPHE